MDVEKVKKSVNFGTGIYLWSWIRWKELRLIFIGHMKEQRTDCQLARLPSPIFKIIVEYTALSRAYKYE
jgi:hypothetical protein